MQFEVNLTNHVTLVYDIVDHEIARDWSKLISLVTVEDCCKFNHYSGNHDPVLLKERIARLYELVEIINVSSPNKIEKVEFDSKNYHNALNIMHVHFPELEKQAEYIHLLPFLREYNDTIHWLEPALVDYYNGVTDNRRFSIKLDFNKAMQPKLHKIPENAYELFNGYFSFGQLMLHYVHVGRHSWELFFANDLACPKEQYLPQYEYNASVRLHFYDNTLDHAVFKNIFKKRWEDFYKRRGGKEFFGCEVNDPSIRFGYCQIGSLSSIMINGIETPIPKSNEEINSFRNMLVTTKIIDWKIK